VRTYVIRMNPSAVEAEAMSELMPRLPADVRERVLDQIWLRAVFVEQRRRTNIAERPALEARADRLLEALDPGEV
jgi:hypothetical protein